MKKEILFCNKCKKYRIALRYFHTSDYDDPEQEQDWQCAHCFEKADIRMVVLR